MRRWFQIHLSTAIIIMITAGALMWGNLTGRKRLIRYADEGSVSEMDHEYLAYGWPVDVLGDKSIVTSNPHISNPITLFEIKAEYYLYAAFDITIAILLLIFICIEWERWIARRNDNTVNSTTTGSSS